MIAYVEAWHGVMTNVEPRVSAGPVCASPMMSTGRYDIHGRRTLGPDILAVQWYYDREDSV
jgi:hypothetical protein